MIKQLGHIIAMTVLLIGFTVLVIAVLGDSREEDDMKLFSDTYKVHFYGGN